MEPICVHKDVFPLLKSEIIAIIILPPLIALASVSGLGGGAIFMPIAIGLLHFSIKNAVAISTGIVFETALLRFVFFSAWKPHPERKDATEIDYNIVKIVYPLFLIGSFTGVYFATAISELALTILMILILSILSIQTLWRSKQIYNDETI